MKARDGVAIVGEDTTQAGRPAPSDLNGCDRRLRLVTFRITNAERGRRIYRDGVHAPSPARPTRPTGAPGTRGSAMPKHSTALNGRLPQYLGVPRPASEGNAGRQ